MKTPGKESLSWFQFNRYWQTVNRQKTVVVLGAIAMVLGGLIYLGLKKSLPPRHVEPSHTASIHFVGPMSQTYGTQEVQSAILDQQRQAEVTAHHAAVLADQVATQKQQLNALTQTVNALQGQVTHLHQQTLRSIKIHLPAVTSTSSQPVQIKPHVLPKAVTSTVHLPMRVVYTPLTIPRMPTHHTANHEAKLWVPSGTFVRAVLLSGADANASINGAKETDPVLLRILDEGTLPNGQHTSLKGCFVTASIYGDISSERGQIRTDLLSCVRPHHQLLNIPVQGTVVGSAGKNGLRGLPVMRNGKILWDASIAGGLSGLSKAAQAGQESQSTSPLGTVTSISGNALTYAASGSIKSAADQLAHYYVQRAEQYHPVIQINPGSVVTIIFLKPFSLSTAQPLAGVSYQADKQQTTKTQADETIGMSLTPQQRAAYLRYMHEVSQHSNPMIQAAPGIVPPASSTTTGGH